VDRGSSWTTRLPEIQYGDAVVPKRVLEICPHSLLLHCITYRLPSESLDPIDLPPLCQPYRQPDTPSTSFNYTVVILEFDSTLDTRHSTHFFPHLNLTMVSQYAPAPSLGARALRLLTTTAINHIS
jgi:hypothetical protein